MSSNFLLRSVYLILCLQCFFCSCRKTENRNTENDLTKSLKTDKLQIVATTGMIADMVSKIGGKYVHTKGLMGPGVDPHLYKPSASDTSSLQQADLIFYNGLLLEGRMSELFDRLGAKKPNSIFALSDILNPKQLLDEDGNSSHPDPHIWGDVSLWSQCIPSIEAALSNKNPEQKKYFAQKAQKLTTELSNLHNWAIDRLSTIPSEKRTLITSHDAFNYFGKAYNFRVVGIQGISTVSEAGLADIAATVDLIQKEKIPAIFVESTVSASTIERISKDSGAKIAGELFSDAMGTPGEMIEIDGQQVDLGTYEGMIRHNVESIYRALAIDPR